MAVTGDDVRDISGLGRNQMDYKLIDRFISEAEIRTYGTFGRNIRQRFRRNSYRHGLTYLLRFKPLVSVERVYLNDEHDDSILVEDAADGYTVDLSAGSVTFEDDVLQDGDGIYFEYVPSIFETIIVYEAALMALTRTHIKVNIDGRGGDRTESVRESLNYYKKMVKSRPISRASSGGFKYPQWRHWV